MANKPRNESHADNSEDISFDSSLDSVSSRKSERRMAKKIPGVIYFYSDESTWVEKDLSVILKKVPVKGEDSTITWNNTNEIVKIVKVGDSLTECKEAQDLFEKLMDAGVPLQQSVKLCEDGKSAAKAIKCVKDKKKSDKGNKKANDKVASKEPSSNAIIEAVTLPPLFAENDFELLGATHNRNPLCANVLDINPTVEVLDILLDVTNAADSTAAKVVNIAPDVSQPIISNSAARVTEGIENLEINDQNVKNLITEITAADTAVEKGNICLHYATVFHEKSDTEIQLMPGFNIFIGRNARKLAIKNCKRNPLKLQRLLLKAIKGDTYIPQHSALGQKKDAGLPPVEKDLLTAVDLFVKARFPDSEVQCINKTFNELASNLRVRQKRREGKLQQSKRKAKEN